MRESFKRVFKGVSANIVSQGINAGYQLLSIPLFLAGWGAEIYGEWLVLMTIPGYLAVSDIGFGTAGTNEMTILVGADETEKALSVFQSVSVFIFCMSGLLCASVALGGVYFPILDILNIGFMSETTFQTCLLLLVLHVFVTFQMSLIVGGFKSVGLYPQSVTYRNFCVAIEYGAALLALSLKVTPVVFAMVMVGGRCFHFIVMRLMLAKKVPWLIFGLKYFDAAHLKKLWVPSASFLGFPFANMMLQQGPVMIIGAALGPIYTVVFTTTRTMINFIEKILSVINMSIWPEFSKAYGEKDFQLMRVLNRRACQVTVWGALVFALGIMLLGREVLAIWTQGEVKPPYMFLASFLIYTFVRSFWFTSSVVPAAVNQHTKIAMLNPVSATIAIGLFYLLIQGGFWEYVPLAFLVNELAMTAIVLPTSLRITQDKLVPFLLNMLYLPKKGYRS